MFPLDIKGSVRLKFEGTVSDRRVKAIAQRVAKMLRDAAASSVSFEADQVDFTAGLFRRAGPLNILFSFDAGTLHVRPHSRAILVRYQLSTVRLITITGVMTGLLGIVLLGASENTGSVVLAVVLGVAWFILLSLSYGVTVLRFPRWLRRGLNNVPELRNTHPSAGEVVSS